MQDVCVPFVHVPPQVLNRTYHRWTIMSFFCYLFSRSDFFIDRKALYSLTKDNSFRKKLNFFKTYSDSLIRNCSRKALELISGYIGLAIFLILRIFE